MHKEEMLDSELDDFSDMGSGHQQPQIQPPYNNNHNNRHHAPFPQQPQYTQHPPYMPQPPSVPQMQQVPFQPPYTPQTNYDPRQQHWPPLNQASSLQQTMTAADLFLACSISKPLPPTAGSSTDVAQRCPTAKDLPPRPHPQPHPPPPQAHNNSGSVPHPGPPQQEALDNPQANPPIPVPAEQVEEVHTSARLKMRRGVLSENGMPTNDNNLVMAHSHKYELGLNIWDTLSEVAHKLQIVPALTTHLQCLFTSEDMALDGILQSVPMLKHDGLVSLVIEIMWTHRFYKDINFDDPKALDGVIALAGAALCSALLEYKTGVYKHIEFSTAKARDTYTVTQKSVPMFVQFHVIALCSTFWRESGLCGVGNGAYRAEI
ncbi:hypothetical protein EDB19DRAFT_1836817 [Suillus lakei]|nr:hypothetical protein EDB19DRAFT_1836817 [Suillus lakei]